MNTYPEEISAAIRWWVKLLNQSIPLNNVTLFEKAFLERCVSKFEGHWFPDNPLKGQAYRSIAFDQTVKPDPLLLAAAQDAQLDIGSMFHNFLENAVMWIDPGEVVVRTTWSYSHRGTEETVFPAQLAASFSSQHASPMELTGQQSAKQLGAMGLSGLGGLGALQGQPMPQPKLTSTGNAKPRHYSPPKAQSNSRNAKQSGNDGHGGKQGQQQAGFRRPSDANKNNQQSDLNIYSSVFVPSSSSYSDYWAPHDRVGLTV